MKHVFVCALILALVYVVKGAWERELAPEEADMQNLADAAAVLGIDLERAAGKIAKAQAVKYWQEIGLALVAVYLLAVALYRM
jgi:hypothetical protein